MSIEAWFTLAVIVVAVACLATERFSAPYVILAAVTVLLVTRVIDAEAAFSGFSSEAPVTVAALYVMAGAAEVTGALDRITATALGRRPRGKRQDRATRRELARVLMPTALLSSVVYNTPTTGMLAPQVSAWARRSRRSPSWYLMALNAAVLLGGLVTSIGTTTNVVVTGLLRGAHQDGLSLFEITPVGLPIAVVGIALTVLLAPRLVPRRQAPSEDVGDDPRHFTFEMKVARDGLVGRTVAEAGLRNLEGVYLVEIERDGTAIAPVAPTERLAQGDRLVFAGNVNHVVDLQRVRGLQSADEHHFSVAGGPGRRFYEAVVAPGSPLGGSTLKDVDFRNRYGAAVVAIHREGEPVAGKLGSIALHPGDVLVVLGPGDLRRRWRGAPEFALTAPMGGGGPVRRDKAWVVGLVVVGFLAAAASGLLPVLHASLIAALLLVGFRVLSPQEARAAIDLNVIVVLAASFGLGAAMASSGLATDIAHLLIRVFGGWGDVGVLGAVLVATVLITQLVTNNATAIVMFPIALATAAQISADPRPFAIAVAVGASSSFLTPIGYQTNMIVYGMGGYRFWDFGRLGIVLVGSTVAIALATIPVFFPLH